MNKEKIHILTEEEYEKIKKERKKEEWKEFKKETSFSERCFMLVVSNGLMWGSFFLLFWKLADTFTLKWFIYKGIGIILAISLYGFYKFEKRIDK